MRTALRFVLPAVSLPLALVSCLNTKPPLSMVEGAEFASGSEDGIAHSFALGMIDAAGQTLGVFLDNVDTAGSMENAEHMAAGTAPLGLVQEDVFAYAQRKFAAQYAADPDQAERKYLEIAAQLQIIMAAYEKAVFLLINTDNVADVHSDADDNPTNLLDLLFATDPVSINLGAVDSDTYITASTILSSHLFTAPYEPHTLDAATGIENVVNGSLDAAFLVDVHPSPILAQIPETAPVTLARVFMPENRKAYREEGSIEEGSYPFQDVWVDETATVRAVLAAGPMFSDRAVDVFIDYAVEAAPEYRTFATQWEEVSLAASEALMRAQPEKFNYRALSHVIGVEPLDPFLLEPAFCSGDSLDAYHDMAVELIYLLSRNLDVDLKEKNTTGAWENSYWLHKGDATMALVQDDIFGYLGQFDDPDSALQAASLRKIAPLHYEYVHLIANTSSINWLRGGPFQTGSGVWLTAKTIDGAGSVSPGRTMVAVPYTPTPETVTGLEVTQGDGQVSLRWIEPTSSAVADTAIWVYEQFAFTEFAGTVDPAGTIIDGLTNGTLYFFLLETRDDNGNTLATTIAAGIAPAAEDPAEVSDLTVAIGDGIFEVRWSDPSGATYERVRLFYDEGGGEQQFLGQVLEGRGIVYPNDYLFHINQVLRDPGGSPRPVLRLNVGPKTSGTFISATRLLASYSEIDSDDDGTPDLEDMEVHYSFDNPADAVAKVASGEYDAAFITSGVPHHKLYAHDTYSLPTNVKILATQFHDRNGDGDFRNDIPAPYVEGVLAGGGLAQVEDYPYAREILLHDIPAVRVRALLTASPVFDDEAIEIYIRSILRKTYYEVNPADPSDLGFVANPLWVPISINSYAAGAAPFETYGENVVGIKEYFVANPFGWSPQSAAFYLTLFPVD